MYAKVRNGLYRNQSVQGVFPLVKPLQQGKKGYFVTVNASGVPNIDRDAIRVIVPQVEDVEYMSELDDTNPISATVGDTPAKAKATETDAEAIERIRKRFAILDEMSNAVVDGIVRGLIVSGPPGVGKSYGVEAVLDMYEAQNKLSGSRPKTEIAKGSMTPIGLYKTLYNNSERGDILVFDDCDSVLFDEVCLNMLKAVLDSGKKRYVSWKSESRALRAEGIPDRFEFRGGCVFITNVNFENVRSKKIKDHLAALMSRCHYIDLEMDTERDRFLRIEQIVRDGMLNEYGFGDDGDQEIVAFMKDNSKRLREISLRMVLKIADLRQMSPSTWRELAENTCMSRG